MCSTSYVLQPPYVSLPGSVFVFELTTGSGVKWRGQVTRGKGHQTESRAMELCYRRDGWREGGSEGGRGRAGSNIGKRFKDPAKESYGLHSFLIRWQELRVLPGVRKSLGTMGCRMKDGDGFERRIWSW